MSVMKWKLTRTILKLTGFLGMTIALVSCSSDVMVETAAELVAAVKDPPVSGIIRLAPGRYELNPQEITDSTCANCQDPAEMVPATAGLLLTGKKIHLIGPDDHSATIVTNSGYGIFFLNCQDGLLENLTVTGGRRDEDPRASSAAVIVKKSGVAIRNNLITDNIGDSAAVIEKIVGIIGIAGREGARMDIHRNRIVRNSWDGIALYRGARAVISENYIDGVDRARGSEAGGGRGVAIGITWDATADVRDNYIANYWKGIGIFVDAQAVVERNIIEDLLTWGIAYWDAATGRPSAQISGNIIYHTGACGVSLDAARDTGGVPGYFNGNIIVRTGQNPRYDAPDYYCYQCALSVSATPADFKIGNNLFMDNRRADTSLPDHDLTPADFREALSKRIEYYNDHPYWEQSKFYREIVSQTR